MKPLRTLLLVWCVACLPTHYAVAQNAEAEVSPSSLGKPSQMHCGTYCVAICMRLLDGTRMSFDEISALVGDAESGVSSLQDISRSLKTLGLDARAATTERPGKTSILRFVRRNDHNIPPHFCVARDLGDGSARVYWPPEYVVVMEWKDIRHMTSRTCLRVSTHSGISFASPAALVFAGFLLVYVGLHKVRRDKRLLLVLICVCGAPVVGCTRTGATPRASSIEVLGSNSVDLGRVLWGRQRCTFQIVNRNSMPVAILGTKSSCGCAGVEFDSDSPLEPDEIREVVVHLDVNGSKQRNIYVDLKLPEREPLRLNVTYSGYRGDAICGGEDLRFGEAQIGTSKSAEVCWTVKDDAVLAQMRGKSVQWMVVDSGEATMVDIEDDVPPDASVPYELCAEVELTPKFRGSGKASATCRIGGFRLATAVSWTGTCILGTECVLSGERRNGRLVFKLVPPDGLQLVRLEGGEAGQECGFDSESKGELECWTIPRDGASVADVLVFLESSEGVVCGAVQIVEGL